MTQLNANQFPEIYASLGVSIPALGVVMLDVDPIPVTEYIISPQEDLYKTADPAKFWINGAVAEQTAHITLLYGLMRPGLEWKSLIDIVLKDWTPPSLEIESVDFFPSPYPEEDYACIVAHIKVTPELLEGNQRLSLLPHIDTFPQYRPHLTLAYVKTEAKDKWIKGLSEYFAANKSARTLTVNKLNYGGTK